MNFAAVNGVELGYETFGHPSDPALLLIAGRSSAMDWWDLGLCRALADGGRYVIRYDQRDTGQSTSSPGDGPGYGDTELADDAAALIAELDHTAAHIVGYAAGGLIAQQLAVRHPARVRSLTLIATGSLAPADLGVPTLVVADAPDELSPAGTWSSLAPAILQVTSGGWDAEAGRLSLRARDAGDPPTAWFDRIYQAGDDGRVAMPWDRSGPNELLADWLAGEQGRQRSAVVVGCGLGGDAEFLAGLDWDTLGFDVAPSAIRLAQQRHPGSKVKYRAASLFDLPVGWRRAFDLVIEIFTVQALPRDVRAEATAAVGSLVAPGGRLLVISGVDGAWPGADDVPPWPLTADELAAFAQDGLSVVEITQLGEGHRVRWRGEFERQDNNADDSARRPSA